MPWSARAPATARPRPAVAPVTRAIRVSVISPPLGDLVSYPGLYGVLYYRLLVGHAPLDEKAAGSLAAELTRSDG
jgi:hypothetical protein